MSSLEWKLLGNWGGRNARANRSRVREREKVFPGSFVMAWRGEEEGETYVRGIDTQCKYERNRRRRDPLARARKERTLCIIVCECVSSPLSLSPTTTRNKHGERKREKLQGRCSLRLSLSLSLSLSLLTSLERHLLLPLH